MRKFIICLVLAVMAVFSLSADEVLKTKTEYWYGGSLQVDVKLVKFEEDYYAVFWVYKNGLNMIDMFPYTSLSDANILWNYSSPAVNRKLYKSMLEKASEEDAKELGIKPGLCALNVYYID